MPYNIDVNVNFGNSNAGFQSLIDNTNRLNTVIGDLGNKIQDFGNKASMSNAKGQKSITDYSGSYKTLTEDIKKNRAALIEELKALENLRKVRTSNTSAQADQINKIKQLESSLKQQTTTLNQYNKALGITKSQAGQATNSLSSLTKGFNSLGAVLGISFGAYGAFRVITDTIKTIADFNLAQKKLQSILSETNKGMKDVSLSAVEIGKGSIFGAKGVTELQIELAKMGFAKDEIVSMQGAIVNLATATQEELAPAAEVVANIIRAFQLPAEDATRVVDIMGKAFNDSALDLANFRESIKYVAPIAKQANFTFAETVSLLEQLSNAGIKGSLAGTGLTNIISRLGNENSKFVKTLGRTVNGFDDFLGALVELKNKGADLTDIFQLVDRRAAATFSILLDGVSTVEQFKKKLEESSGVMKDQAAVQLESLTFKTKMLKNTWDGFILSIDSGDGILSKALGSAVDEATSFLNILNEIVDIGQKGITEKRLQQTLNFYDQLGLPTPEELNNIIKSVTDTRTKIGANALDIALSLISGKPSGGQTAKLIENNINSVLDKADEGVNKKIQELAMSDVTVWKESIGANWNEQLATLISALELKNNETDRGTIEFKKQVDILKLLKIEYEAYLKTKSLAVPGETDKKALQERYKYELELLELQKKIAAEEIRIAETGNGEKIKLAQNDLKFDLLINDKKLESAIALGEDKNKAQERTNAQGRIIELTFANSLTDIWDDLVKSNEKAWEEIGKKRDDRFKVYAKNREDEISALFEFISNEQDKMFAKSKFEQENPIASLLGITDTNQLDIAKQSFDFLKDQVSSLADSWVSSMDKIVDSRNRMVDEAQQALETEIALAEAGFASNVSMRRKELADAKKLREQAIQEQYKAAKIQLAIDTATQSQSLVTSAAQLIASGTKFGIPGLLIAFSAITMMFATFKKFKLLAQENAAQKFERGGEVGGRRHVHGGTMIEAEQGEYVVNRNSFSKHKKMVEAINNDDTYTMNRLYINGLKNGVLNARVSLDDSEDLKAIRMSLEKSTSHVSYVGNYRIEKTGNVTTRIALN